MKRQEPFNVLRNPNSWSNVPRDPATIAINAIAYAQGAGVLGAVGAGFVKVATLAVTLGLSVAANAIISALTPAPPTPKQSILVNSRDAAAPQEIVYGTVRKGGPITYLETVNGGSVLYQIIAIAAHEVDAIEAIYINDEVATLSNDSFGPNSRGREGAGWVLNDNWTDDPGEHEIRIFYHLGNQTSITDTFANSSVESLDSVFFDTGDTDLDSQNFGGTGQPTKASFVGNGIAYIFVRYSYASGVFRNGIPTITARVRGKKVFNPVTTGTSYSSNAARCIRDYLTSAYGLNDPEVYDATGTDEMSFSAAANTCDEDVNLGTDGNWALSTAYVVGDTVTNDAASYICILDHTSSASDEPGVGGSAGTYWEAYTEKRYTINGVVRADQSYGDVLQEMATACAGTLFWGAGKWKLQVGEYNAPTKTLTLDDLRSEISLQTRVNLRDQFNKVQGTFVDSNQRYITADYPPIESAAFLAEDDGVEQPLNLDLPFTTSSATAQRLAKMTLFRGREQMTFSADFGLNAFDVEVGEIVALTIDRYGWDEKEFEVVGWRFGANDEAGDLRITLTLRETSEAAFDWGAEESEIISNNTGLETPRLSASTIDLDGSTVSRNDSGQLIVKTGGVDTVQLNAAAATEGSSDDATPNQLGTGINTPHRVSTASIVIPANETARFLIQVFFEQGYPNFPTVDSWRYKIQPSIEETDGTFVTNLTARERTIGMGAAADLAVVAFEGEYTNPTSNERVYVIDVDWYGEGSDIRLQRVTSSVSGFWR